MKSFKEFINEKKEQYVVSNGKKSFVKKNLSYTNKIDNAELFSDKEKAEEHAFEARSHHRTMTLKAYKVSDFK